MNHRGKLGTTTRAGLVAVLATLALSITPAAHAATTGFNGYYDYSTWTASTNIPGPATTVSTIDPSQQTLTLFEPDGESYGGPNQEGWFDFSHTVGASGTVSFDWAFNWDIDWCCSGFNVYINSTLYNLANGYPGDPYNDTGGDASGTFSASVNAGDVITLQAFTADNCCLPANTVITNFQGGAGPAVPEPASALLLGAGLAGLVGWRRLRRHGLGK